MDTAPRAAFLFDLDGTLIDSVYQHVLAWREVLEQGGIRLSVWRIHRRIGMSGGLFVNALLRETGREIAGDEAERLQQLHAKASARLVSQVRPLPGAEQLLAHLSQTQVPYAIATSGRPETARPALKALKVPPEIPIVTRDQVRHAKPDPDLFLTAADRLGVSIHDSIVVGDSVWDLLAVLGPVDIWAFWRLALIWASVGLRGSFGFFICGFSGRVWPYLAFMLWGGLAGFGWHFLQTLENRRAGILVRR